MTTERNVLATIRAHAESHRRMADCDAYSAQEAPRLESALAAVAELVEASEESFAEIFRLRDAMFRVYATAANGGDVAQKIEAMRDAMDAPWSVDRLRAALAPFTGEQA